MGTRRKSRELVLQMLFQADMGKQTIDHVQRTFWAEHGSASAEVRGFADDLFRVATDRVTEIDGLIEKHAEHWRMERMAAVDRNLLRAAVAEMLGYKETPRAVVINEALEIARKFSSPESVHFVNGVLDSVGKELGEQLPRPARARPVLAQVGASLRDLLRIFAACPALPCRAFLSRRPAARIDVLPPPLRGS